MPRIVKPPLVAFGIELRSFFRNRRKKMVMYLAKRRGWKGKTYHSAKKFHRKFERRRLARANQASRWANVPPAQPLQSNQTQENSDVTPNT